MEKLPITMILPRHNDSRLHHMIELHVTVLRPRHIIKGSLCLPQFCLPQLGVSLPESTTDV